MQARADPDTQASGGSTAMIPASGEERAARLITIDLPSKITPGHSCSGSSMPTQAAAANRSPCITCRTMELRPICASIKPDMIEMDTSRLKLSTSWIYIITYIQYTSRIPCPQPEIRTTACKRAALLCTYFLNHKLPPVQDFLPGSAASGTSILVFDQRIHLAAGRAPGMCP